MPQEGQNLEDPGRPVRFENGPALDLSVIIVSWNAKNYLLKCLKSLSQNPASVAMEIIVVDNDSSDGSPEMVEQEFPAVRLIRSGGNLGFGKANNIGIRVSKGRYLGLINSDVEVLGDCVSRLISYLEHHPETGMVGPRIIGGDGKLQRSCRGFPGVWNMFCRALALDSIFPRCKFFTGYSLRHWSQDCERPVDILTGCFWLARREVVERVGLLDELFFMYGEDMDWCKRFWDNGSRLVFVPSAEAIHYGGVSSSNAPLRFYIEKQRADLQYWKKHHSRLAVVSFFLISILNLTLRAIGYCVALLCARGDRRACKYKVRRSLACLQWMVSGRLPRVKEAIF